MEMEMRILIIMIIMVKNWINIELLFLIVTLIDKYISTYNYNIYYEN